MNFNDKLCNRKEKFLLKIQLISKNIYFFLIMGLNKTTFSTHKILVFLFENCLLTSKKNVLLLSLSYTKKKK